MDTKAQEKQLYDEYRKKLAEVKKVEKEKEAVGQVFTKGLLPIYLLYILSLGSTNGNDIAKQIGKRTKGLWIPSTGGIYPQLKKLEKQGFVEGSWDDPNKKFQKIYKLTDSGLQEFESKKTLLEEKIREALRVFTIIYNDLY
ncbi:MAG: PadR family transcriptional regulator [Sarcina sp.]